MQKTDRAGRQSVARSPSAREQRQAAVDAPPNGVSATSSNAGSPPTRPTATAAHAATTHADGAPVRPTASRLGGGVADSLHQRPPTSTVPRGQGGLGAAASPPSSLDTHRGFAIQKPPGAVPYGGGPGASPRVGAARADAPPSANRDRGRGASRQTPRGSGGDFTPYEAAPQAPSKHPRIRVRDRRRERTERRATERAEKKAAERTLRKFIPRFRLGRPVNTTYADWKERVADELESLGLWKQADAFRLCGSRALVYGCDSCGEGLAAVVVPTSCDLRICPWCARVQAQERVSLVSGAADRAVDMIAAGRDQALKDLRDALLQAEGAAATHRAVAAGAIQRSLLPSRSEALRAEDHSICERACVRETKALDRLRAAKREIHAVEQSGSWSWKLITITEPWSPLDPQEYTPARLRARALSVVSRWTRCWEAGARAGGLAFASLRVELSSHGHVHAHVLYRGPWVAQSWWQATAGSIVDVREIQRRPSDGGPDFGGLREAIKYALKTISPTRGDWIAGKSWRCVHPELAAAWAAATTHLQLIRHFGIADICVRAEKVAPTEDPDAETSTSDKNPLCCWRCNAIISSLARVMPTAAAAKALGPHWPKALHLTRAGPDGPPGPSLVRSDSASSPSVSGARTHSGQSWCPDDDSDWDSCPEAD